ncbi:MAG TPA: hypothetical protein PKM73_13565 [Verrucomicrobiota bacterium]|nr:hypothetical protein [Verrucomicrobiota bacterium]HNU51547.1 hypothetical protein [Verrucomicrobiota bacterium]
MQSTQQAQVASASNGESHHTFDLILAFENDWSENALAIDADGAVWIGHGRVALVGDDEFIPGRRVSLSQAVRWFRDMDPLSSGRSGNEEGQARFCTIVADALEGREP